MHFPVPKPKKRAFSSMNISRSKFLHAMLLACATLAPSYQLLRAEENPQATSPATTTEERISRDLSYLAADDREGRGVGTDGIWQAGEYIAKRYQELGFQTELFEKTPFQNFNISGENKVGAAEHNRLVFKKEGGETIELKLGSDFSPLSLGKNGSFADGIVFAGYGISAKDLNYDDYASVDVTNKVVIVLRKEPRPNDPNSPFDGTQPSQYSFFTAKEANAAVHKAAAVIFVNDRSTLEQGNADKQKQVADALTKFADLNSRWTEVLQKNEPAEVAKLRAELKMSISSLQSAETKLDQPSDQLLEVNAAGRAMSQDRVPTFSCTREVIDRLLKAALGQSLAELEADIDGDLKPRSAELKGWTADGETLVEQQQIVARNVIGLFPGKGDLAKEIVVVGAHYDHVGMGGAGSLAPGTIAVHNGADDNASGTTTMLEVAHRLSTNSATNRRTLVFMAFSGEERGLLGSAHYVRNPRFALEDTVAMVNMDMVGRMTEDQLTIFGTGTATEFDSLVDKLNTKYKFDLNKDPAGRGPSDHQSFFEKKIPVFHFFTGLHNDYHRPSDDFDKINLNGMVRITDMVTELVEILVTQDTKPTFVDVRGVGNVGNRPRARAVLGVQLKTEAVDGKWGIQQVVPEGAAAGAGLKPDDIVISVAGTAIVERDDITKVLSAKRPGDKVEVKFTRDGQEQSVEVTLGRG
jgi:Zn-dependent M28 family amino/carboxypeptidase